MLPAARDSEGRHLVNHTRRLLSSGRDSVAPASLGHSRGEHSAPAKWDPNWCSEARRASEIERVFVEWVNKGDALWGCFGRGLRSPRRAWTDPGFGVLSPWSPRAPAPPARVRGTCDAETAVQKAEKSNDFRKVTQSSKSREPDLFQWAFYSCFFVHIFVTPPFLESMFSFLWG